jgi:hypothetical protein
MEVPGTLRDRNRKTKTAPLRMAPDRRRVRHQHPGRVLVAAAHFADQVMKIVLPGHRSLGGSIGPRYFLSGSFVSAPL